MTGRGHVIPGTTVFKLFLNYNTGLLYTGVPVFCTVYELQRPASEDSGTMGTESTGTFRIRYLGIYLPYF
jgi:hypothetical protein